MEEIITMGDNLSLGPIEIQLIDYFNLHEIVLPAGITEMFHRCCMRIMYLYLNHPRVYESLCCRECEEENEKEDEEDDDEENEEKYEGEVEEN
jgi:hypothetical protein